MLNQKNKSMVVFFDGVCNLCLGSVRYLIKHDKKNALKFASLQGPYAKSFLPTTELESLDSILFYDGKNLYKKSSAVLKLSKLLGGWHRLLLLGHLLPVFIRNGLYDLVAKNRYQWFGRQDQCMQPSADLKSRFLD
jgi:predicted DCC family thiol-disulfide oxidoreductase YuxK